MYTVKRLNRLQVDTDRWNTCVKNSPDRPPYGYSWYLDAVTNCPDWRWEGLVLLDKSEQYAAVMPVPLRRKYGFWVVHQPLFCPCLGLYGSDLTLAIGNAFIQALRHYYSYGSIVHVDALTASRLALSGTPHYTLHSCTTYTLDLSRSYQAIRQGYSPDTRRHLRQAEAAGWQVQDSTDPAMLLTLFRKHHAHQIPSGVADWVYELLRGLLAALQARGLLSMRYASRESIVEAGVVFIQLDNWIVYLFNAASPAGRQYHARTILIDQLLREKAEQPDIWFDFESPEKESIARFYRQFGATASPYWAARWNHLPLPLQWGLQLKRYLTA